MVDRAQPGAIDSIIRGDELRQVFGRFSEGFIVPGTEPTPAAQRRGDIDETALDAFTLTTSATALDVTVAPGEGFVGGWFCRDRPTTLTLPPNATVDIVVGFNDQAIFDPNTDADRDDADEVIVDLNDNVDATTPTTVAHRVTTDGGGVVSSERIARIGSSIQVDNVEARDTFTGPGGNTSTDRVGLPAGAVIMFTGSTSNIPDGYTLCDGTDPRSGSSSVPDLRNRFISGAGDEYNVGVTGGEKEHQLTESEMPSHSHQYQKASRTVEPETFGSFDVFEEPTADAQTNDTGDDQPHENRPRFFALAFIMRL